MAAIRSNAIIVSYITHINYEQFNYCGICGWIELNCDCHAII